MNYPNVFNQIWFIIQFSSKFMNETMKNIFSFYEPRFHPQYVPIKIGTIIRYTAFWNWRNPSNTNVFLHSYFFISLALLISSLEQSQMSLKSTDRWRAWNFSLQNFFSTSTWTMRGKETQKHEPTSNKSMQCHCHFWEWNVLVEIRWIINLLPFSS